MISQDFFTYLEEVAKEYRIDKETYIRYLEAGIASAFKKQFNEARNIEIRLNENKNEIKFFSYRTVVDIITDGEKQISLADARQIKKSYKIGDNVYEPLDSKKLNRNAVYIAMQVVRQRLQDGNRDRIISEMSSREGEIMTGTVRKIDERDNVYFELLGTQIEGILPPREKIRGESYPLESSCKVYIKKVKNDTRGAQIILSRACPEFVKRLCELEIPEIAEGTVEIKRVERDPGERCKIAVHATKVGIDALGACIGNRGQRINAISSELHGEKIDVILWDENPEIFIARALSPATVRYISCDHEKNSSLVLVDDDKLSLAIGKKGQNAGLAVRLTGWKIDVKPISKHLEDLKSQYATEGDVQVEDTSIDGDPDEE